MRLSRRDVRPARRRASPTEPQLEEGEPVDDVASPRRQAPAGSASMRASTCSGWWAIARSANRSRSAPASRNRWPAVARVRTGCATAGRTSGAQDRDQGDGETQPVGQGATAATCCRPASARPLAAAAGAVEGPADVVADQGDLRHGPAGVAQPPGEVRRRRSRSCTPAPRGAASRRAPAARCLIHTTIQSTRTRSPVTWSVRRTDASAYNFMAPSVPRNGQGARQSWSVVG